MGLRVGLVTTWNERCGLASYSANVVKHLPQIKWKIIGRNDWGVNFLNVPNAVKNCDVVHIMHQGGIMGTMRPEIVQLCGKTVITRHCIGDENVFRAAQIKTAHVPMQGYRFVPHGIPVVDVSDVEKYPIPCIGCAGIPFDGKGHFEAVQIAEKLGWGVNLVMPENPHTSHLLATYIKSYCKEKNIPLFLEERWLSEEKVVRILAKSWVNIFYYTRWANGISGAVRLGLAAKQPVVISKHSQFADISSSGHVMVAESIQEAADLIEKGHLKDPKPLTDMWGFDKTARMYKDIYNELYG